MVRLYIVFLFTVIVYVCCIVYALVYMLEISAHVCALVFLL